MTVCVSVKVSEGLVLAADSAGVISGTIQDKEGNTSTAVLKTYEHFRKLLHVKDYPIGTLTWGTARIGARSVESLIKEYEYSLPSVAEEEEKSKGRRMRGITEDSGAFQYDVRTVGQGLLQHIHKHYEAEYSSLPSDKRPLLGILVSGYSAKQFFPTQWLTVFPNAPELQEVRPDQNGKPDFGANWFGLTDAIVRLHWGRDDHALGILAERFQTKPDDIREILSPLQYSVDFGGMPVQDAIDYAVYLIGVVIGRFRFVVGAPLCIGPTDVAVITPNAFTWVERKSWHV